LYIDTDKKSDPREAGFDLTPGRGKTTKYVFSFVGSVSVPAKNAMCQYNSLFVGFDDPHYGAILWVWLIIPQHFSLALLKLLIL
jgi:hypothetical protein